MKDHKWCVRGFSRLSKAWYGSTVSKVEGVDFVDTITIGMYDPEGGTSGEFQVRWGKLAGDIIPRLQCYDAGWSALLQFQDMLDWMASVDDDNVTPDQFADKLRELGVEDLTKTKRG